MPATSKQQQKFMGLVRAVQKGEVPKSKVSNAIKKVAKSMKKKEVELIITLPAQRKLVDEGYDPIYGARPLRRAAISILEDNLYLVHSLILEV